MDECDVCGGDGSTCNPAVQGTDVTLVSDTHSTVCNKLGIPLRSYPLSIEIVDDCINRFQPTNPFSYDNFRLCQIYRIYRRQFQF